MVLSCDWKLHRDLNYTICMEVTMEQQCAIIWLLNSRKAINVGLSSTAWAATGFQSFCFCKFQFLKATYYCEHSAIGTWVVRDCLQQFSSVSSDYCLIKLPNQALWKISTSPVILQDYTSLLSLFSNWLSSINSCHLPPKKMCHAIKLPQQCQHLYLSPPPPPFLINNPGCVERCLYWASSIKTQFETTMWWQHSDYTPVMRK